MNRPFIENLITRYGYPLYVYQESILKKQIRILQNTFEDFSVYYSFKCNPNSRILHYMASNGLGADTASPGEVDKALKAGFLPEDIVYSAPAKTLTDIKQCMDHATIVADSLYELEQIEQIGKSIGRKINVGLRINPAFSLDTDAFEVMGGGPSKFGVDFELLEENHAFFESLTALNITGIHVYMGSQLLDADTICGNIKGVLSIARYCIEKLQWPLSFINFGGGFGVPYHDSETPLNMPLIKTKVKEILNAQHCVDPKKIRLIIESGRFLTAQSGYFITKVLDIKQSRGKKYLLVAGGMNGFFRPAFTNLYHPTSLPFVENKDKELVSVGGNLCTPLDMLANDIMLPACSRGDIMVFGNAGAYGYTMSLQDFISHPHAKEIYVDSQNKCFES